MNSVKIRKGIKKVIGPIFPYLPDRIRYGVHHASMVKILEEAEKWNVDQIYDYQYTKLMELLVHCYSHVPFYKEYWDKNGVVISEIKNISEITKLPFIDKKIIRENLSNLSATNIKQRHKMLVTTGGSTGIPSQLYRDKRNKYDMERAFMEHLWKRVGCTFKTPRLVLRGPIILTKKKWSWISAERELICSTYHFDDNHMDTYFAKMREYNIEAIHGHVSSVVTFAQYLIRNKLFYKLKAVLGASEHVFDFQREIIKKAFGCRLYSWYGQTEQVCLGGEGINSQDYQLFPTYGITELLDNRGNPVIVPGRVGEIVATGFMNNVMPLIRYRTGDYASYSNSGNNREENSYPKISGVEGRSHEYVYTNTGLKISLTGLIFGQHYKCFEKIKKMQLIQRKIGHLEILVVREENYGKKDELEIESIINKATDNGINMKFSYTDNIPPTKRGKHLFLIQHVDSMSHPN